MMIWKAACVLACTMMAGGADAASFDGAWAATGPAQSPMCPGISAHFTVKGDGFGATVGTVKFTYRFRGTIAADGTFDQKSPGGTAHIAGKFAGESLTLQFSNDQCPVPREATGGRSR
jgi:hypothetical protein